jgi:prepilin-type N-terminal cleavage/methylation domain-containing protein
MNHNQYGTAQTSRGFTLLELVVVLAISLVIAGIAVPNMVQTWYGLQLRASAGEVADLMQRARMQAARANITPGLPIRYQVANGVQQVFVDYNNNGVWDKGGANPEPGADLARITAAASAPGGGAGTPSAFVDNMDTTAGPPCDNTCTLAFSPRGLPCNLVGNACPTPSPSYFVYYFQDGRPNGWVAVLVSKAGRTRVLLWNGTTWN